MGFLEAGVNGWSGFWLFHPGMYWLIVLRTEYPSEGLGLIFVAAYVVYLYILGV